jgi:hypothetical protein
MEDICTEPFCALRLRRWHRWRVWRRWRVRHSHLNVALAAIPHLNAALAATWTGHENSTRLAGQILTGRQCHCAAHVCRLLNF